MTGKHYWEYRGVPVLREPADDQSFDPRFLDAPADCVLFGYFQSPRYFASIADSFRAELNSLLAQAVLEAPGKMPGPRWRGHLARRPFRNDSPKPTRWRSMSVAATT